MTRRPLAGAAVLCAALLLAACHGSPEAGRVTPAPTATSASATPPSPSSPATPAWTSEELAAIAVAKSRYITAHAAIDKALNEPLKSSRTPLERAGIGDSWLITAIGDVRSYRNNGWYQSGAVKVASLTVESVDLGGEQPEVRLKSCLDSSATTIRFQTDGKAVPLGPGNGPRHRFRARLVYAAPAGKITKMWFLIEEKTIGSC